MELRKIVLLIFIVITFAFGCSTVDKTEKYEIKGYITGMFEGTAYLSKLVEGKLLDIDSVEMRKFKFKFSGKVEGAPELHYIRLGKGSSIMEFFLENSEIQIDADIAKLEKAKITGSKSQQEYQEFLENNAVFDNKQQVLFNQFEKARANQDTSLLLHLEEDYQQVFEERKAFILKFVNDHSESPAASLVLARSLADIITDEELEKLASKYTISQPKSVYTQEINNKLSARKRTAINQVAPAFVLPDLTGEQVELKNFLGKTVLLNFWMPKNGNSRLKNKFYKNLYTNYKAKGFEIISVAISDDKEYCKNVVQADSATWVQLSDFKSFDSPIVEKYGIRNINDAFLVDKEGIILAKNFTEKELVTFLENIYK